MPERFPTRVGDVVILQTADRSFRTYAVAVVTHDGQQDVQGSDVLYVPLRDEAIHEAKALVQPGCRILLRDLEKRTWEEIPHGLAHVGSPGTELEFAL